MQDDESFMQVEQPLYGVGLLGAVASDPVLLSGARLEMIERRILRIEMAMRRAGIEVESLGLAVQSALRAGVGRDA